MKKIKKNIIGVLGGMGPFASAEFLRLLMDKSVREFAAVNNNDFPEVVLDSVPVPDFIHTTANIPVAKAMLIKRIKQLNEFGVNQVCIACNTAHMLIDELRAVSAVPIVSIMEEVELVVNEKTVSRVGLLATPITYRMNLYKAIDTKQRKLVIPTKKEQVALEEIIRKVIAGEDISILKKQAKIIGESIVRNHALDCVILGCTELPLVLPNVLSVDSIDTLDVLSTAVLERHFGRKADI